MNIFFRALNVLRRRGLGFIWYLLTGFLLPRISYKFISGVSKRRLKAFAYIGSALLLVASIIAGRLLLGQHINLVAVLAVVGLIFMAVRFGAPKVFVWLMQRQARAFMVKAQSLWRDEVFTTWEELPLDMATRARIGAARAASTGGDLVIGSIDHDIRVLGTFGPIPILPQVNENEFLVRPRFKLDVVLVNNKVLVRKDFRGDKVSFINEWRNLVALAGTVNVSEIYKVDERRLVIYKNLILGRIVRDLLLEAGAKIMSVQNREDQELAKLDKVARLERVVSRGTKLIPQCLSEDFLCDMERQIDLMHAQGITGVTPTFGNVIIEKKSGAPYFIDFDGARAHFSTQSPLFTFRRDQDRVKFNHRYGRQMMTERSARSALAERSAKAPGWYAPIDFGKGLTIGGFWSTDSGTGRWEFFNKKIMTPLIRGKRLLDLGSNNGVMPVMMLRAGASEVVGVELSPFNVESAKLVQRIFEWRDMRSYKLTIHNANMLEVLDADWGKFDVVTALCSLYYLEPEEMARVVRRAAELAPVMVIQANVATRRQAAKRKSEKASTEFIKTLLEENGFPDVEVYAPPKFSRPILVGRAARRLPERQELPSAGQVVNETPQPVLGRYANDVR